MWEVPGRDLTFVADDYTTIAEQFQVASELYLANLTLLLDRTPCYVRYAFSHKSHAELQILKAMSLPGILSR